MSNDSTFRLFIKSKLFIKFLRRTNCLNFVSFPKLSGFFILLLVKFKSSNSVNFSNGFKSSIKLLERFKLFRLVACSSP